MTIIVQLKPTVSASALVDKIKDAIDSGTIVTWSYDEDGDFTHKTEQWQRKGWLKPYEYDSLNQLRLGLVGVQRRKDKKRVGMKRIVYGVYHGRFIEMLLAHFPNDFTQVQATSESTHIDSFVWE